MDAIVWPSTKFPVQIQLQKFYSTFGPREVYNDYNGMGEWIYDQYNGSIGLVAGCIGMTLYNSQDTFPCYDPRASTLCWYLPQVTAKSDPCIDYQVLWSRAT